MVIYCPLKAFVWSARDFYWPSEKVGFFYVSGCVAVTTVSMLVVKTALSQHQLIFRDRLLPTEWVESNGAVGLFIFCQLKTKEKFKGEQAEQSVQQMQHTSPDSFLAYKADLMSLSRASHALLWACSGNFPLKSSRHSRASATYLSSNRQRASLKWALRCPGFKLRAFKQSLRAS